MKKKLLLAGVAAAIVSTSASAPAFAQNWGHRDDHRGGWHDNRGGNQWRSWHRGDRFESRYAQNYRRIDYRHYHGLRAPPRGYYWAQSGNDAVLVAATTGIIASIVANAVR